MMYPTRTLELSPKDNDHCKRLKDPLDGHLYHLEVFLPFSEAANLERGNANLRPPSEKKKPFRDMVGTVERDPASFHLKNRGITYLCDRFEYDNTKRRLQVTIPDLPPSDPNAFSDDVPRFGIADGGHTFEVIRQTVARINQLKEEQEGWTEPYVRVHVLAGEAIDEIDQVVEALNTSSQVQQYTLDEYQNQFAELKEALATAGFDTSLVAFRENEEDKEWDIREMIQRMACFLRDRWKTTQPTQMYRSKGKALDFYTNELTRPDFRKLYGVIRDVVTLPEFIQSQFSQGGLVKGKRFGGLRAVKTLKKEYIRPGTDFPTEHEMDLSASLPIAAAFRELLELRGDRYHWKVDPREAFKRCAEEMYKLLASKSRTAKSVNSLGSDTELWTQAVNIILRTKDEMLTETAYTTKA